MKKLLCLIVVIALVLGALAHSHGDRDVCAKGGELRRNYNCAAIRHTTANVCCWTRADGTHGHLPRNCCGTGWHTHGCEKLVDEVCEKHHEDI